MSDADVITRPNGKVYRPRNPGLRAHAWEGEDDGGVIVFGTLDPNRARPFAAEMCNHWYGMPIAVDAQPGWYRDGFRYGERAWIRDEERGAPGVMFRAEDAPLGEVHPTVDADECPTLAAVIAGTHTGGHDDSACGWCADIRRRAERHAQP